MARFYSPARAAAGLLVGSLLLTGCDFDVYQLPLPGGADTGDDPITVTAEFEDVLDLVPQSSVKVDEVTVGKVTDVELDGYTAVVTLEIRNDTGLPDNALAVIRQTSLLGEKFVSLDAPPTGASDEPLGNDDVIPLERTDRNFEVEEVLGALSLVLNGGGVAQLKTIAAELNLALEGREDSARSVLNQIESLGGQLDRRKADIVDAIESLNRLAIGAREQQGSIDAALEELPSALDSLASQRGDLVAMLQALADLGDVGVRVINQTRQETISSLQQLEPVLTQLAAAGDSFAKAFSSFLTFPFVDETVGRDPQVARNLHMGDFTNLSVELDLNLLNLDLPGLPCVELENLPDLPIDDLLDLPNLCDGVVDAIQTCLDNPSAQTCGDLPANVLEAVCDAVSLPALCRQLAQADADDDDPLGGLDDTLDGLGLSQLDLSQLGLGRAPYGGSDGDGARGVDGTEGFDPALVGLLTAPLVTEGAPR